ncbi:hypothetical protein PISMIDRAFT_272189 [Pisolithus microcarpus 441]|uniref:Uncharacterized protein n=1 Tax=Pisolithus microcarpus 441 TaxID=765257 RepID=A0A0C9ZK45_9AGAM|nr:hypothetical protein BKA83DRAFT_272189 [Pisolithus microcarpus]KIK26319.1 hypothetical protein PISMIDRAFT_272189 [Pisolithus microcarpus 441]
MRVCRRDSFCVREDSNLVFLSSSLSVPSCFLLLGCCDLIVDNSISSLYLLHATFFQLAFRIISSILYTICSIDSLVSALERRHCFLTLIATLYPFIQILFLFLDTHASRSITLIRTHC